MAVTRRSAASLAKSHAARASTRTKGSMGAAEAKTHLLSLIDEVKEGGTPVIITRRGEPQVKLSPLDAEPPVRDIFGCMKGTVTITGDIIGPEPDEWEAMQ